MVDEVVPDATEVYLVRDDDEVWLVTCRSQPLAALFASALDAEYRSQGLTEFRLELREV